MFRNYLLTTLRSILKRKAFTFLNVSGLAIGTAASLLILQYVKDELSYDDFHTKGENIYRVRFDSYRNGELNLRAASSFPKIGPAMKDEFPEVENYTRLFLRYGGEVVRYEETRIKEENLFQAEQSFFEVFSYKLIEGDPATALKEPNTAVIEKETARKYFGNESALGKRIRVGTREEYEIRGVVESPENSHLKFTFLLSYSTLVNLWGKDFNEAWGWYDFYNYLQLKPGTDIAALEAKFPAFIEKYGGAKASERTKFALEPMLDIHLYSNHLQEARVNGNGDSVYFLSVIAFFILVIAWINYINLSTARAIERAKEVGIRKAIGAARRQLMGQFVGEAFLVNLVASVFGLILVYSAIPLFNQIAGKQLSYSIFYDSNLWLALGGLYFAGSLLSGLYPAFVISSYQPVKVLKGSAQGTREGLVLRKSLVVGQFVASVALIAGTIIVYSQLQFMQNKDLGINIDQTVVINGPGVIAADSLYRGSLDIYRNELASHPNIKSFTAASEIPGNLIYWTSGSMNLAEAEADQRGSIMGVDYEFFKTFEAKIIAGRGYAPEFTGDSSSVVLNRKALEVLNLGSPDEAIGKKIKIGRDTLTLIGVLENYHHEGLKQEFRQTAFHLQRAARSYFIAKMSSNDAQQTIAYMRDKYMAVFPDNPFDYFYLDGFFGRQYRNEQQFGSVFGFFAMLAIFVASLGLFGLASYTAAQRTKEIGIRKVMGSSVTGVFMLLSKDFLKLVLIANVVAIPLVWYGMNQWLNLFAFRITISVWVFAVAALLTTFIALITVSYQSITAATANPVKSLRYE